MDGLASECLCQEGGGSHGRSEGRGGSAEVRLVRAREDETLVEIAPVNVQGHEKL